MLTKGASSAWLPPVSGMASMVALFTVRASTAKVEVLEGWNQATKPIPVAGLTSREGCSALAPGERSTGACQSVLGVKRANIARLAVPGYWV